MKLMNILFICKYNRFRSKLAEAFFKKLNKNNKHKTKSAGIIKGNPVSSNIKNYARHNGLKISGGPRTIDVPILKWQDIIIIVADDVPRSVFQEGVKFYGKQVRQWRIKDVPESSLTKEERTAKYIEKKVIKLVKELDE